VRVRAARVPVFARYLVYVRYRVGGKAAEERFEGGTIASGAPSRVLKGLADDRLEVRVVSHDIEEERRRRRRPVSWLVAHLKNVSTVEAGGLEATLELRAGRRTLKRLTVPLDPPVLAAGAERRYRVRLGVLPEHDGRRVTGGFDEPAAEAGKLEIEAGLADQVGVTALAVTRGKEGAVLHGRVTNGLKTRVSGIVVSVVFTRGDKVVQNLVVDALAEGTLEAGASRDFRQALPKAAEHDSLTASVVYAIPKE
jgi:hypothetical protein